MNEDRFEAEHGAMLNALKEARGDCPPAERLLDWAEGALDDEAARMIDAHVMLCTQCSEAVERAREPDAEVDEVSWRRSARNLEARGAPWQATRPRAQPAWFAAAAAAVAALAILVAYWPGPEQALAPPVSTVRDADLELIEPVGAVSELPIFRWSGLPAPVRYRVELVATVDAGTQVEAIWDHTTASTRVRPDDSLGARLTPGRAYRWRVVVLDEEGEVLSRSNWVTFELKD